MKRAVATAALALALPACASSAEQEFAERDPHGARACSELAEAIENPDEAVTRAYASGEAALRSTTPQIKAATVHVLGDTWAHAGQMIQACRAEGVDMPETPTA